MTGNHLILASLSTDQIIAISGLFVSIIQAIVLPFTLYLLVIQTRAMRQQTTALVEQSKEMTTQTHIFTDTIYNSTYQGIYDAEAHIGDLMMAYPEASRILMNPTTPMPDRGDAPQIHNEMGNREKDHLLLAFLSL